MRSVLRILRTRRTGGPDARRSLLPRDKRPVVHQLEPAFRPRSLGEIQNRPTPDLDAFRQASRLPNARHDHERLGRFVEQEVFVLGQEQEVLLDESVSNSPIGRAAPPESDDVLDVLAFRGQPSVQREGKVLIQEDLQEAWRTAGGTCAAMWAAYARAARTCSTDS